MISVSLFYCCEKVFIHMITWVIGENLMRHHYQKKKIFMMEDITDAHYEHAKSVCKDFEQKFK